MKASELTDSAELYELQKALTEADERLSQLAPQMGKAYHVLEYDSDQRKAALARAMTPYLEKGESHNKAEAMARASFNYKQEMLRLEQAHETAASVKFEYEALKISIDVKRSLVSMEKELAKL
jgi:hypothetical protein